MGGRTGEILDFQGVILLMIMALLSQKTANYTEKNTAS